MRISKKDTNPTAGSSSSATPPWIELPIDVTANILHRLGAIEILASAEKVCTTWQTVCKDPAMWRVIDVRQPGCLMGLDMMCRRAVDRSQGQLIDIHMEDCGDDETLLYVCERSSHLRRLSLANCCGISGKALTKAVNKLPLLEELHLIIVQGVPPRHIKTIGNSCPMLKSFTFNLPGRTPPFLVESEDDDDLEEEMLSDESEDEDFVVEAYLGSKYALAIAKSMPNLRHLQLFANYMRNDGLQALLDGCPHVESLDIRQCYHIDLSGVLGDRCLQQIKNIRLPFASVDDYKWDAGANKHYSDSYYFDDYEFG